MSTVATLLKGWETFYVIIGSSAGALIGLQFVVITLIADGNRPSAERISIDAFGTPTVLHFVVVLVLSLIANTPWQSLWMMGAALAASGIAGLVYVGLAVTRVRRQSTYQLVLEDWVWYTALPLVAYAALIAAAIVTRRSVSASLFAVAGTALLLLLIGIHNAWDTVTYIAIDLRKPNA